MRSARVKLPGHPDKACDLVAEGIVDEYLRRDPEARIRLHVSGGRGALFVCGDVKSTADFDVSAAVRRTLGSLGIVTELEPFVSLEPVSPEQTAIFAQGHDTPVTVTGYATDETPEMVPLTLWLAKRIAKALEDKRSSDESWYWLGPDGEVQVHANGSQPDSIHILIEHGTAPLAGIRGQISSLVNNLTSGVQVNVNSLGPNETRGLAHVTGASSRWERAYGSPLPAVSTGMGLDVQRAEKAGVWLTRHAARKLMMKGAKAAMVTAVYLPGEKLPSRIQARDERGRDLTQEIEPSSLSLERAMTEWWRPGLCSDAARWGFAGEAGLPWEV